MKKSNSTGPYSITWGCNTDTAVLLFKGEKETHLMDKELVDPTSERLYELYISECSHRGVTPSIHEYLIWLDENGYEKEEVDLV